MRCSGGGAGNESLAALEIAVVRSEDWAVVSSPRNRSNACGIGSGGGREQGNCAKRPELVREWTPLAAFVSARSFPGLAVCALAFSREILVNEAKWWK